MQKQEIVIVFENPFNNFYPIRLLQKTLVDKLVYDGIESEVFVTTDLKNKNIEIVVKSGFCETAYKSIKEELENTGIRAAAEIRLVYNNERYVDFAFDLGQKYTRPDNEIFQMGAEFLMREMEEKKQSFVLIHFDKYGNDYGVYTDSGKVTSADDLADLYRGMLGNLF